MHLGAVDEIDARVGHGHLNLHVAVVEQEQQRAAWTGPAHRGDAGGRLEHRFDARFGDGGAQDPRHRPAFGLRGDVDRTPLSKPVAGDRRTTVQSRSREVREDLGACQSDELAPDVAMGLGSVGELDLDLLVISQGKPVDHLQAQETPERFGTSAWADIPNRSGVSWAWRWSTMPLKKDITSV